MRTRRWLPEPALLANGTSVVLSRVHAHGVQALDKGAMMAQAACSAPADGDVHRRSEDRGMLT